MQHRLEPGGYVPKVYKDLWIPPSSEYPQGESIVVMEKMGRDGLKILRDFLSAFHSRTPWAMSLNRLHMSIDGVDGLAYAHSQGYIHLDYKLENYMERLSSSQRFAIIDWDMAVDVTKPQRSWPLKGTPLYMAPGKTQNPNCCG